VLQVVAQIPWGHNQALLNKLEDREQRLWYAQKVIENGWSRNSLEHHIKSDLISRQGKAITNFSLTLPEVQSDLAQDLLKSEYNLEFIDLKEKALEREIEQALVSHIQKFLLELGVGFAFVGRQHRLEVEGDEFFIDLLFYHVQLRCYVVIELKTAEFRPEFSGQINFYVNVVDDQLKHPDDQPTIGLVLCRSRKKSIVHYALRGMSQPIGVSTYELGKALPSVEQLEHEIESASVEFEKTEQ
jgi:predicted nuclease of restriction endonuclease-like (RecB) superfamily